MPNYASQFTDPGGNGSVAYPSEAGQVVSNRYTFQLGRNGIPASLLVNDIIDLGLLPAGCTVEDVIIDTDDLDTNGTPTISLDVGIMTGTPGDVVSARTCGQEFFAGDQTARTGGVTRMTRSQGFRVPATGADRSIGVRVATAAATWATGNPSFTLQVRIRG